ncbi:hypothetical protein P8452_55409 [Trifolium repens]|nr:hypothetical protein P8452_55409 [Trifolium repens]
MTNPMCNNFVSRTMSMEEQEIRSENARLMERSKLTHLASTAMDELIKMAEPDSHLWIKSLERGNEVFNHDEYENIRSPFNTPKPNGFVTEVTRETVMLHTTNTAALIETFLDADRWAEMFPCMIVEAETLDVLSNGMDGTKNGSMQLMHVEIQLPTPLVSVREYNLIRFCKQQAC